MFKHRVKTTFSTCRSIICCRAQKLESVTEPSVGPPYVKVPCPEGAGEVLISHTKVIEPVGG